MKRLYIILISALFVFGFAFANDFVINLTPSSQSGISGSVVDFNISASNNTGFAVFVTQTFPLQIKYKNANILPINNPALSLGTETIPRWSLPAGQNLNLNIQAEVVAQAFPILNVNANVVNTSLFVLTSAVANVAPIADLNVQKSMVGSGPQITGDNVTYNIVVKNIGSAIATGVSLVDVWPSSVVTFPNQGFVNGVSQIPTIYNSLANNYMFSINDLAPGASATIQIIGTMNSLFPVGQTFANQAFVLTESSQYTTTNDNVSITNSVRGIPNIYVNIAKTSTGPALIGDLVTYLISYGNNGTESATGIVLQSVLAGELSYLTSSLAPINQSANNVSWSLGSLAVGQSGQITVTTTFLGGISVGVPFVSSSQIATSDMEVNMSDNLSSVTGYVLGLPEMGIQIYANNLTDPSRNTNTGQNILAISGDNVQLEMVLVNSGNVSLTGIVSLTNITGFVSYGAATGWTVFLNPGTSQNIVVNGIVGPRNFVAFAPRANLIYSGINVFDTVLIDEQLICGDGLLTQNEQCDINGPIGNILPGQTCVEESGQCVLRTDNITNTVCMNYVTNMGTGQQCMNVAIDYQETEITNAMCNNISSPSNTIVVNSNNQGSMNFTCTSQNNVIANQIRIDCGNGNTGTANSVSSFTHACNYVYNPSVGNTGNTYNVRCYVDNHTRNECASSIRLNEGYYGICGNGQLDAGEDCDLGSNIANRTIIGNYLDLSQNYLAGIYGNGNYYCQNCRIREDETNQFAYQPPQCLGTNTTISLMENELMPFWWRLWDRQEQLVRSDYNCNSISANETRTIINKDSMRCTFSVYDGNRHQQLNNNPLNTFVTDCYEKDNSIMFEYFEDAYKINFDKVSGRYVYTTNNMFDGNVDTYGEYKLVLEKIDYDYCNPSTNSWQAGRTYQGVCEVNFALTRPYIMQISTFGIDPVATTASDFLKDFYDMRGNNLIESTDINETIAVTSASYGFDSDVLNQMDSFKKKYEPLAITVDNKFKVRGNKTVGDLFSNGVVKKVPNQLIFFVKGNGQLILKQLTEFFPGTPFTIYVEGMDVLVEGSVVTNGMIITDGKISFEDDSSKSYCEAGGQIVNGIFVARGGFDSVDRTRNVDKNQERCPWGNLHVKGILIGNGVENLVNNRRSHLNDWFNVKSDVESAIKRERKDEIFQGSALLIEYNPTLWTKLPPGADAFTKTLDVYRK